MAARVVITGLGPVSPIGIGKEQFWDALMRGRSGARRINFDDAEMDQYKSQVGCPIEDFSLENIIEKSKDTRHMGRTSEFALAATKIALEDAGFDLSYHVDDMSVGRYTISGLNPEEIGVILGVSAENMDLCEKWHRSFIKHNGPRRVSPFALPYIQICAAVVCVTLKYGINGSAASVSTACASSNHAMIAAYKQILLGEEKVFVTGGADACLTPYVFGGFTVLNAMSKRNDDPERASRPFDKDRDGFVMGEGSGVLVLEELNHALERGAHIYCEVTGYGTTSDAYHITAPDPGGEVQAQAITKALNRANCEPEEIDYINAHGTSTPLNDKTETTAIKKALGRAASDIPISSTKSMTGHLIGAAGGIEAIATALTIEHGKIHPTINLENPDDECDLDYVPGSPRTKDVKKTLSNSFGFGGQNATILLQRFEP